MIVEYKRAVNQNVINQGALAVGDRKEWTSFGANGIEHGGGGALRRR
jgi:hypothetical protein